MNVPSLLAVLGAWCLGTLVVLALRPRQPAAPGDTLLVLSLGLGLGLGLTSGIFFAVSLAVPEPAGLTAWLEGGLGAVLAIRVWRRGRAAAAGPRPPAARDPWGVILLGSFLFQACIVTLVTAVRVVRSAPHGDSDGWTIWNMHARLLYRGGTEWAALLRTPAFDWSHPDYPLLIPASVARLWAGAGHDAAAASGLISILLGVAAVGVLVGAVMRLRPPVVGLVGGLVLVGTPFFVYLSGSQHADIAAGYYYLVTLVLLAEADRAPSGEGWAILAGAAAGLAAWTKNEGWLFILAVGVAWGLPSAGRGSWRALGRFAAGLLVALLPVLYFKLMLAPGNDLVDSQPWERWRDVLDGSRHRLILATFWRDLGRFGEWSVVPYLAMLLPLAGGGWRHLAWGEGRVGRVLLLMLGGFYVVYLLTSAELAGHLDSSLVRLLLQLWPAAIFFWCLAVTYEPPLLAYAPCGRLGRRARGVTILLANLAVAGALALVLGRQLASNQLAAAGRAGSRADIFLGAGWFARETYGGEVWAWSKGESTLLLSTGEPPREVALRVVLRGLGARTVVVRQAGRILWQGPVGEAEAVLKIGGVRLESGMNPITFATAAPGVREAPVPEARALTFAIYNPRVE